MEPDSRPEASAIATTPLTSIPIPSVPRRTAPPRRKGPASSTGNAVVARNDPAEPEQRLESQQGDIEPPPQVMVADEEKSLPKTGEQLGKERQQEEVGRGARGAEGAAAAGIALMPVAGGESEDVTDTQRTLVGAVGTAGSEARGMGTILDRGGRGQIVEGQEDKPEELEKGFKEVGEDKDELMMEAEREYLDVEQPADKEAVPRSQPVAMVPLHPPAEEGGTRNLKPHEALPPPPSPGMMGMPKDEVELKHAHDTAAAREKADEQGPAPPSRRPESADRPLGPRPLPSPGKIPSHARGGDDRPLPAPPGGNPMVTPRNEEEVDRKADGEEDEEGEGEEEEGEGEGEREGEGEGEEEEEKEEEAPALPLPRRQPSLPTPLQMGLPTPVNNQASSRISSPGMSSFSADCTNAYLG